MKKILFMLFLLSANVIFSEDIPTLNMELVKTFPIGQGNEKLSLCLQCPSGGNPSAIAFDKKGNLYISDIVAERLVKFDPAFNYNEEFCDGYAAWAKQLFITDNNEFLIINHSTIAMDDAAGNIKFEIALFDSPYKNKVPASTDFVYINNKVFFRFKSGELAVIDSPGADNKQNIKKIKKVTQTNSNESNNKQGQSMNKDAQNEKIQKLDNLDIITFEDKVKTSEFSIFKKFWHNKKGAEKKQLSKKENPSTDEDEEYNLDILKEKSNSSLTFIGNDPAGNYYWDANGNVVCVFNSEGSLLKCFSYDMNKSNTLPTVHPSGDVYFLGYDGEGVYLYKVTRVW